MKNFMPILSLVTIISTYSFAFDLQVDLKNLKADQKDVKSAEVLTKALSDYFPNLLDGIKLNICGSGGPTCTPENSYLLESNEINLELTAYAASGELKYKPGALQVLAHEFGHAIFMQRAAFRHSNYGKLFAAIKYKIEQDKKLIVAKSKNLNKEVQEIETEFETQKEAIQIATNYLYGSFFYQEVYSDLLMAAHFNNPDAMCLAIDGTVKCTSPYSSVRRFSVSTTIGTAKNLTDGNSMGQHTALAGARKALWQKYQSLLKAGNSKSMALNFLLDLMIDESYEVIFGKKTYSIEEMNKSLIKSLQTYGK